MRETDRSVTPQQLKDRKKRFAISVGSGTPVAANYRAVCRARSKEEFIARTGIVVEEADETVFWLEVLTETGIVKEEKVASVIAEVDELLAIFASSLRTAKYGKKRLDQEMTQ